MTLVYLAIGFLVVFSVAFVASSLKHPTPEALSEEHVLNELRAGNKLLAIRWYRTLHGAGLKQAVSEVEALARRHGIELKE